jgi:hypothetical protein
MILKPSLSFAGPREYRWQGLEMPDIRTLSAVVRNVESRVEELPLCMVMFVLIHAVCGMRMPDGIA